MESALARLLPYHIGKNGNLKDGILIGRTKIQSIAINLIYLDYSQVTKLLLTQHLSWQMPAVGP